MLKRVLLACATTPIVGFGVWIALFFIAGMCTFFGEDAPSLFEVLSVLAVLAGVIAALFWAFRRIRGDRVKPSEWGLFVFAALSLAALAQHTIAEDAHEFLAFNPALAAERDTPTQAGDKLKFVGNTSMGVRVYSVERGGKIWRIVGVFPKLNLYWTNAYSMGLDDYEKLVQNGTLDKPVP